MQYRRVGKAGLKVSAVAVGGWLTFEDLRQSGVREVVRMALDKGINYFDLADDYGHGAAEEFFGNMMREFRREDLVLATKAYWPMSEDPNDRGLSRKHLLESLNLALHRLNTEYVDLFICHRFDEETTVEEVVRAMDHVIRQGRVLYWGMSMWTTEQVTEAVTIARELGCYPPVLDQPRYNILDRGIETDLLPAMAKLGMGVAAFSALAEGMLTGKYGDGIPRGSRADLNEDLKERLSERDLQVARELAPIAADLGITQAQLALAWVLRRPEVTCALTGATDRFQVEENAAAGDITLTDDVVAAIEALLARVPAS